MAGSTEALTREDASRRWMKRARGAAVQRQVAPQIGVTYGLIAVAWALLHLAERLGALGWAVVKPGGGVDWPPKEVSRQDADLT